MVEFGDQAVAEDRGERLRWFFPPSDAGVEGAVEEECAATHFPIVSAVDHHAPSIYVTVRTAGFRRRIPASRLPCIVPEKMASWRIADH